MIAIILIVLYVISVIYQAKKIKVCEKETYNTTR